MDAFETPRPDRGAAVLEPQHATERRAEGLTHFKHWSSLGVYEISRYALR
jgi:hypothetical protein